MTKEALQISSSECNISELAKKPFLILDAYVLLANVRTGVYRTCDEIFKRLVISEEVETCLIVRNAADASLAQCYLEHALPNYECGVIFGRGAIESIVACNELVFMVLPFGVPPIEWQVIPKLRYAHFSYDIIAARRPEFFTAQAVDEVARIIDWLQEVDLIYAISEYTKNDLIDYAKGGLKGEVVVALLAADAAKFNLEPSKDNESIGFQFDLHASDKYILSVGTLEIRKNLDTCIRAFGFLVDELGVDKKLVLTGMKGWKGEKMTSAFESLSVKAKKRIVFTGFVSDEQLAWLYKNAWCFLYMSEYEGFGLPPLEAMSCGVPVICSNTTSIPEVVGDGGILIDPYDSTQLAMRLKYLMDDESYYHKLQKLARDRAKLFNWDKTVSTLINAFSLAPRNLVLDQSGLGAPPLVSYITVSYNAETSIEKTIKSILVCKKILSCEYIVVDGNSTDGTSEILRSYADAIDRLIVEDDKGIYDAMNKGISFAKGDYICFVNADDWLIPEGVKKIKGLLLAKHPRADIFTTAALSIDGSLEYRWNPGGLDNFSVFSCPNLCHNALYARTSLFREVGVFDTQLKIAADSDWIIRAFRAGAAFVSNKAITVAYVIGGASSDHRLHAEDMVAIARKHYPGLSESLINDLFYYFFAWQDRRHLFVDKPNDHLKKVLRKASKIYPELSAPPISLKQVAKQLTFRGYAKLKKLYKRFD